MPVPYSFGAATSAIPLSQLDANFNTPITLGNTAIQLGNTVTTLNNMTLANVTISSGNVTITNVTVTTANATTVNTTTLIATTANVTTGNVTNLISGNVSLTGGSITGTPISGSTGSFTTLTTSSTVTLNGGTANGVAYLNASKVLTSGSALTFDGTTLTNGGNIVALGGDFSGQGASGYVQLRAGSSDTNTMIIRGASAGARFEYVINGSEQMRLTSTGLGIGTSSPTAKLVVYGGLDTTYNANIIVASTASTAKIAFEPAGITSGIQGLNDGGLAFLCAGANTERMRLDSSGNLGLGVTPSAWSQGRAIEVFQQGYGVWNGDRSAYLMANAYFNSGFKYAISGNAASHYYQFQGAHVWSTAASGTAGNAITFTQAMTLTSGGNLLLGGTTDNAKVNIQGGGSLGQFILYFNGTSTNYYDADTQIFRSANATERARIDSSGNLLVGTTSTAAGQGGHTVVLNGTATALNTFHGNGTASSARYHAFYYDAGEIGSISQNGTTAVAYNTTSDYRLKENVQPMTGALAKVAQLKPCTYNWKVDGSAGEGFIAHELAEVCHQAVTGEKDAVNKDGSIKPQGIDTSFLVATLTAAIQELKAEFDAYKATHP